MRRTLTVLLVLIALGLVVRSMMFTVDETQYAIVTTFGKPKTPITKPGLYWKLPTPAQTVLYFDNRMQIFDPQPTENFTLDRKNLVVDSYACWRITDAERFLKQVATMTGAENSLGMLLASELGTELGKHELSALVSVEADEVMLDEIMAAVTERCGVVTEDYGIEVEDIRIKRINLPYENKQSVYERMRAEREEKAKTYRAEGEEQATTIRAKTELEKRQILSTAYKEAQKIKGEGDAEAIRIYADAYGQDPQFYKFMRTLASYKKILDGQTTVVLSSDTELLKLLTDFEPFTTQDQTQGAPPKALQDATTPKPSAPSNGQPEAPPRDFPVPVLSGDTPEKDLRAAEPQAPQREPLKRNAPGTDKRQLQRRKQQP